MMNLGDELRIKKLDAEERNYETLVKTLFRLADEGRHSHSITHLNQLPNDLRLRLHNLGLATDLCEDSYYGNLEKYLLIVW